MRGFIHRHLDPSVRLGEILFSLIMALGFTASVRIGLGEADNRELFVGILGCNLAWAIVDGVMYVLTELFERGRTARLLRDVRAAASDEQAMESIAAALDERLTLTMTAEDRQHLQGWLLGIVRRGDPVPPRLRREDLLGGVAVGLVILLATFPLLVPFLLMTNPDHAVRVSNCIALAMLFGLGTSWGREVGRRPWHIGAGLMSVGIVLVLITIALGG